MPDNGSPARKPLSEEELELLSRRRQHGGDEAFGGHEDSGDEFSSASPAFYDQPIRRTNFCRLFFVGTAIVLACLGVAALIDERYSEPPVPLKGRSPRFIGDSVLAAMDRSADPCGNFYEYACGSWLRKSRIPPDRTSYSRSFSHVFDTIREELRTLLKVDLQAPRHPNAIAGRFYTACMAGVATGPLNIRPLRPFKKSFYSFSDTSSFANILGTLHLASSAGMYDVGVGIDDKNPNQYAVFFSQGGLGLSHRDKYTSMKDADVKLRAAYVKLIEDHLYAAAKGRLISHHSDVGQLAPQVFDFEKSLAAIHKPPEERRNPVERYNPMKVAELPPSLHFNEYLQKLKVDPAIMNQTVIVDNREYVQKVSELISSIETNKETMMAAKGYLAFHLVRHFAGKGILGKDLYTKNFEFKSLQTGVKQMPERWKICQSFTSRYLGDALGEAFVNKHFPKERKDAAQRLAVQITSSFGDSLKTLEWMDAATRSAAEGKLNSISWKLGYTSKFDKYPGVKITNTAFANNVINALKYAVRYSLNRLGKPVDKTEWFMNSFEVNAYYSPSRNEMVFPAGILQQPFFSDAFPDAMNFGSIGSVIGHEMSHGFDDSGRKYDKGGRLRSWWTTKSAQRYVSKAKCFVDLFNGYKPRSVDIYVIGNLTLGENLADTNGVKVAFHAFKSSANNSDPNARAPNPVLSKELTNHQLFFVAYAQTWCTNNRPRALALQMTTDPHSPGQFRVQGPLSQNPDFAKAFKCKVGTTYNPENKCALW